MSLRDEGKSYAAILNYLNAVKVFYKINDIIVILLLASSGIRLGAIPAIGLRNLEDNKLTVYENTREEYITFITPEFKKAIDFYLDMRSRYGEKLTDSSYLIREQFDIRINLQ